MLPRYTLYSLKRSHPVDSILFTQHLRSVYVRTVLFSHLPDSLVCKLGEGASFSSTCSVSNDCVSDVIRLRSFDNMSRVNTGRRVACMSADRSRPVPIGKVECETMGIYQFTVKSAHSVAVLFHGKWPDQTLVRSVVLNSALKPMEFGSGFGRCDDRFYSDRLGIHRCSSKAMVLGRDRCATSDSLAIVAQG